MALVNQAKREINAKIVVYGPGLAGKATNLKHVYNKLKPEFRGTMKAMNVQDARMLFFDFTPPGDGNVEGYRVRFHVYTISGRVVDPAAWKMVLKGVDGVVFVADASRLRLAENRESLDHLATYLQGYGQSVSSIPLVFQYNKSDLADAVGVAELEGLLNPSKLPNFKASSQSGEGVLQTLLGLVKSVLVGLRAKGLDGIASGDGLQRMVEAQAAVPLSPDQATAALKPDAGKQQPPALQESAPVPPAPEPAAETVAPAVQAAAVQALENAAPEAEAVAAKAAQAPEEPLSLEITGVPELTAPGLFRLPLTIRSGARSKSVVLSLALSVEEG